jgi:DNA-binding response OmpR family regulator
MIMPSAMTSESWNDQIVPHRPGRLGNGTVLLCGLKQLTVPFANAIQARGKQVHVVDAPARAVEEARRLRPSLVLVGPGVDDDPFGVLAELASALGDRRILYLSPSRDRDSARRALTHGAGDVVPPPHTISAVLFRAAVFSSRSQAGSPEPGAEGFEPRLVLYPGSRTIFFRDGAVNLTARELDLLERLLEAGGHVAGRAELLSDIWGEEQTSEAVLDATVHRLRRKLEDDPANPRLLTTVRGIGYRLDASRIRIAEPSEGAA